MRTLPLTYKIKRATKGLHANVYKFPKKGAVLNQFGFNGQLKDNEIYGEGNAYTAEFWEYDPRSIRRWNRDPKSFPSFSSYACSGNNPIYFEDVRGDYFYATTRNDRKTLTAALKLLFGDNNGFKFKKNRLYYQGSREMNDWRKEYVLDLFLDNVVNSSNNHVFYKNEGFAVGLPNIYYSDSPFWRDYYKTQNVTVAEIQSESTITVKENEKFYSTIFISGINIEVLSKDGGKITHKPERLFWHALGHVLANQRLDLSIRSSLKDRALGSTQTQGFDNFIAEILGESQRSGLDHGFENVPESQGEDPYYRTDFNNYKNQRIAKIIVDTMKTIKNKAQ